MEINNETIELVGYGHADRFSDYLGELILEKNLEQDPNAKVALEVLATGKTISLGGEITSDANIDYEELVYFAIEKIYGEKWWPNFRQNVKIYNHIVEQSIELKEIQNEDQEIKAGDQGVIYGFYDKERFEKIKKLYKLMEKVRENFDIAPDWKLLYNEKEISMSVCGKVNHSSIKKFIEKELNNKKTNVIINPKGEWLIAGPLGDTGVIGRKLMIDTFGAGIPHGGGAFCGKDLSKVDKTGILWATKIAKKYSIANKINTVIVELNFKIGDNHPKIFINNEEIEISKLNLINLSLDQFIKTENLINEKWSKHVIKGSSVLSWLEEL
ncbi:MAG: S-adenosylmethionine synthase [Candidatus Tyloplasma litorale]|nr:MAG: S-adenosylmethionine synthase [Mycoplasmatales bacterium]